MKTEAGTFWPGAMTRPRRADGCGLLRGRRGWAGFTLVELLVVIAILALVMGMLLPGLGGFFDSSRGPNAYNLISATLRGTRNYAVANNVTAAVVFVADDDGGKYRTVMFQAEQVLDSSLYDNVVFRAVAGRDAVYLPDNVVVSVNRAEPGEDFYPYRIVVVCFSPNGQLVQISDDQNANDDPVIEPPANLELDVEPIEDPDLSSVTNFYVYDFKSSPQELYDLYINYYTGAVMAQ